MNFNCLSSTAASGSDAADSLRKKNADPMKLDIIRVPRDATELIRATSTDPSELYIMTCDLAFPTLSSACYMLNYFYAKGMWLVLQLILVHLNWCDFARVASAVDFDLWDCVGKIGSASSRKIMLHVFEKFMHPLLHPCTAKYYNLVLLDEFRLRSLSPFQLMIEAVDYLGFSTYKQFERLNYTFTEPYLVTREPRGIDDISFNPKFPIVAIVSQGSVFFFAYDRFDASRRNGPQNIFQLTFETERCVSISRIGWSPEGHYASFFTYDKAAEQPRLPPGPDRLKQESKKLHVCYYNRETHTITEIGFSKPALEWHHKCGFESTNHWRGPHELLIFNGTHLGSLQFNFPMKTINVNMVQNNLHDAMHSLLTLSKINDRRLLFQKIYFLAVSPNNPDLLFGVVHCNQRGHSHHRILIYSISLQKSLFVIHVPGALTSLHSPDQVLFTYAMMSHASYSNTGECILQDTSETHFFNCPFTRIYNSGDRQIQEIRFNDWQNTDYPKNIYAAEINISALSTFIGSSSSPTIVSPPSETAGHGEHRDPPDGNSTENYDSSASGSQSTTAPTVGCSDPDLIKMLVHDRYRHFLFSYIPIYIQNVCLPNRFFLSRHHFALLN